MIKAKRDVQKNVQFCFVDARVRALIINDIITVYHFSRTHLSTATPIVKWVNIEQHRNLFNQPKCKNSSHVDQNVYVSIHIPAQISSVHNSKITVNFAFENISLQLIQIHIKAEYFRGHFLKRRKLAFA